MATKYPSFNRTELFQIIAGAAANGGAGTYGAAHFATSQVTASHTASLLAAARPTRRSGAVRNLDDLISIAYGGPGVTMSTGFVVKPGESQPVNTVAAIYVVAASGLPAVNFTETYD